MSPKPRTSIFSQLPALIPCWYVHFSSCHKHFYRFYMFKSLYLFILGCAHGMRKLPGQEVDQSHCSDKCWILNPLGQQGTPIKTLFFFFFLNGLPQIKGNLTISNNGTIMKWVWVPLLSNKITPSVYKWDFAATWKSDYNIIITDMIWSSFCRNTEKHICVYI